MSTLHCNPLKWCSGLYNNIPKINNPIWFFMFLSTFLLSTSAFSDEVTSKGTVLRGKVLSFSSSGVEFETEYGKGTISIPWKNIEAIKTEGPFQVLYGKDKEIDAQVQGLSASPPNSCEYFPHNFVRIL